MIILHEVYNMQMHNFTYFRRDYGIAYEIRNVTTLISRAMCCSGYTGYLICKCMYLCICMYTYLATCKISLYSCCT